MAVKLSSYRVTAAMDATAYAAGMAQKVAADKTGTASAVQVGAAITATQNKVSQAGDVLTRLSRSYVEGFGAAERFTRAVNTLGRGIETGNVPMARAEMILDGIYRKYGLTANAADLLEQGHYQLAAAVTSLNAKLAAETTILDVNAAAQSRNFAGVNGMMMQRRNLMYQLVDIGQGIPLMFQSPGYGLLNLGNQMAQIGQAYYGQGGMGAALKDMGGMLGATVTKLLPVAAAVAVVATMFAAFTTEINRGQKQQVGFFDVVIAGWELMSEAIGRALDPVVKWFGWLWDQVSPIIAQLGVYLIQTFDLAFRNIGAIFGSLPAMLGDLTISTAQAVLDGVEGMLNGAIKLLNDFASGARDLLEYLGINVGKIGEVDFGQLENKWKGAMGSLPGKFQQNLQDVKNTDYLGALGDRAREVANRPSAEEAKKMAAEAEKLAKAYRDLIDGGQKFIADQNLQARSLGMTVEAAARLRYEQDLLNKAANDNIKLTSGQREEIAGLAVEMAAAEEATRRLTEIYDFGKQLTNSFFSDLKSGLQDGQSAWEALGNAASNVLDTIANKALSMAANGIWDMLFGAVMGGLSGGFGGFGGQAGVGMGNPLNLGTGIGFGSYGSFDGGGFTGYGSRSGGIDGKGGFPAVLHPNETVIDHTRGAANQNAPRAANDSLPPIVINNTINVPAGTNPETAPAIAREVTKELRRQLPDAIKAVQKNDLRRVG